MFTTSSRFALRHRPAGIAQCRVLSQGRTSTGWASRALTSTSRSFAGRSHGATAPVWLASAVAIATTLALANPLSGVNTTKLDAIPSSGDVILLGAVKEKSTGILFPKQCNGFTLAGTGVRIKYGFVKVYAVGTYLDPLAMSGIKGQPRDVVQKALLNPMYPRTIRIVMARGLSIQKFTDALNESLRPRMNGEDLHT
jgi:hypothetical protein